MAAAGMQAPQSVSMALHKAAQKGDETETQRLLEEGADPAAKDIEGRTPLHHAVMRGHLQVVELLIQAGPPSVLLSKDVLQCTPIHLAAVQNQVTLILQLVAALLRDTQGTTPIHEIARRNCLQDFMGFLHLGWDIAARQDPAPLDGAPAAPPLSPEWAAVAAEIDLDRPGLAAVRGTMGWTPLHMAAMEGKTPLIRRLVTEFGCSLTQRAANSWTPLHYAAAHNQVEAIEELIRLGCDADVRDSVSSTPMHVAAGEGHLEAIILLVQLGCAAAVKDRDGCTPLYCAAAWNQVEAVRQLDRLGCPSWQKSLEGRTPVHVAAEQGWVELIDLLVRELKNKVDNRDAYQFTPLHSAANGGHVTTIKKLIHFSHDVDVKDYLGRTPLHNAAMHGRVAAIAELVRQGASLRERDLRGGYTPLHLAADAGQCEAIEMLASLGAPLEAKSTKGYTPLALATFKGPANVDAIGLLIEKGSKVSAVLEYPALETPLHIAARCGRLDIIRTLLRCKVPVNVKAKDGSYPLHYAAAFGQSHVVEALVRGGCQVDARDDAQNTALHLATGCGFYETVEKLVEMGADMNARDVMSCTPLQNAAHGTYSALAAMPAPGSTNGTGSQRNIVGLPNTPSTLTPAQTATQLALTTGSASRNGKVAVRTGLAWASMDPAPAPGREQEGGTALSQWGKDLLSGAVGGLESEVSGVGSTTPGGLGFMQLLKRATKRRGGSSALPLSSDSLLGGHKGEGERQTEGGLEVLVRGTDALRAGNLEQDRSRLLAVAAHLVELGCDVDARDSEGRTALHLAAGCGDGAMVIQLVKLGSDVNCKDSVGGTPMHHAAMANKKDMMFDLARLGCDWRARAEGIDDATAAFVLCGQHGKTTRQQKLVEAKLKRVQQEGMAARSQAQAGAGLPRVTTQAETEGEAEDRGALADANMAALLEEVQLEDQWSKLSVTKRKRRKKKNVKGRASFGDGEGEGLQEDIMSQTEEEELTEGGTNGSPNPTPDPSPPDLSSLRLAAEEPVGDVEARNGVGSPSVAGAAQASMAAGESNQGEFPPNPGTQEPEIVRATPAQEAARRALDDAIAAAVGILDAAKQEGGEEERAVATSELDAAIERATLEGVSAKYAKKVRRRMQGGSTTRQPMDEGSERRTSGDSARWEASDLESEPGEAAESENSRSVVDGSVVDEPLGVVVEKPPGRKEQKHAPHEAAQKGSKGAKATSNGNAKAAHPGAPAPGSKKQQKAAGASRGEKVVRAIPHPPKTATTAQQNPQSSPRHKPAASHAKEAVQKPASQARTPRKIATAQPVQPPPRHPPPPRATPAWTKHTIPPAVMNGRPPGSSVSSVPPAVINGPPPPASRAPGPAAWGVPPQTWPQHQGAPPPPQPPPPARAPQHYSAFAPEGLQYHHPAAHSATDLPHPRGSLSHARSASSELNGPYREGYQQRSEGYQRWPETHRGSGPRDSGPPPGEGYGGYPPQGPHRQQREGYGGFQPNESHGGWDNGGWDHGNRENVAHGGGPYRDGFDGPRGGAYGGGSQAGGGYGARDPRGSVSRQNSGGYPQDGGRPYQGDTAAPRHGYADHRQNGPATASFRRDAAQEPKWDTQPTRHPQRDVTTSARSHAQCGPTSDGFGRGGDWEPRAPQARSRGPEAQRGEKPQGMVYSDLSATARQWVPAGVAPKPELWPEVQKPREREEDLHRRLPNLDVGMTGSRASYEAPSPHSLPSHPSAGSQASQVWQKEEASHSYGSFPRQPSQDHPPALYPWGGMQPPQHPMTSASQIWQPPAPPTSTLPMWTRSAPPEGGMENGNRHPAHAKLPDALDSAYMDNIGQELAASVLAPEDNRQPGPTLGAGAHVSRPGLGQLW